MNPIPVAIADDDAGMRGIMRRILDRSGGFEIVAEADSGDMMLDQFQRLRPKLVILDVEMPGLNGIECARAIQDTDPHTIIIFSTAHDDYMQEAFEVYAFDYLIKPFKVERALKTLSLVKERLVTPPQTPPADASRMIIKGREGVNFVSVDEIALVQREERMTALYTRDGKRYMTGESLSEIDERLPDGKFFRTHKSYIVNLDLIDSITPYGRWTYVIRLRGIPQDALITHDNYEALKARFGGEN